MELILYSNGNIQLSTVIWMKSQKYVKEERTRMKRREKENPNSIVSFKSRMHIEG